MRITTAFNRLLKLDGANVTAVAIGDDTVTVEVRLRRRKLACPECDFTTWARYDTRPVASSWRSARGSTSSTSIPESSFSSFRLNSCCDSLRSACSFR